MNEGAFNLGAGPPFSAASARAQMFREGDDPMLLEPSAAVQLLKTTRRLGLLLLGLSAAAAGGAMLAMSNQSSFRDIGQLSIASFAMAAVGFVAYDSARKADRASEVEAARFRISLMKPDSKHLKQLVAKLQLEVRGLRQAIANHLDALDDVELPHCVVKQGLYGTKLQVSSATLSNAAIIEILKEQVEANPNIIEIDLRGCINFTGAHFPFSSFPKLHALQLGRTSITDAALSEICEKLQDTLYMLNFVGGTDISSRSLQQLSKGLIVINEEGESNQQQKMEELFSLVNQLRTILTGDITLYEQLVDRTNKVVQLLEQHGWFLSKPDFEQLFLWNGDIKSKLLPILSPEGELPTLLTDLSNTIDHMAVKKGHSKKHNDAVKESAKALRAYCEEQLQPERLTQRFKLIIQLLKEQHGPALYNVTGLDLSRLSKLTERHFQYLCDFFAESCPVLEELDFSSCPGLTGESLGCLKDLPLKKLSLRGCEYLKWDKLGLLPKRSLQQLDLSGCPQFDASTQQTIRQLFPGTEVLF